MARGLLYNPSVSDDKATVESYNPDQFQGWLPQDHPYTDWRVVKPITMIRKPRQLAKRQPAERQTAKCQTAAPIAFADTAPLQLADTTPYPPMVQLPERKRKKPVKRQKDPTGALQVLKSVEVPLILEGAPDPPRKRFGKLWLVLCVVAVALAPLAIFATVRGLTGAVAKQIAAQKREAAADRAVALQDIPILSVSSVQTEQPQADDVAPAVERKVRLKRRRRARRARRAHHRRHRTRQIHNKVDVDALLTGG